MNAFINRKQRQILLLTFLSIFVFEYTEAQVKVDSLYSISKVEDKYPKWSPDGEYIVFESNRPGIKSQIFSMKSDGTAITQLTNNQLLNETPVWSPDGTMIMYSSYLDDDRLNNDIFIMNSDGSGVRRLTNKPLRDDHATFSPDGKKIIFGSQRDDTGNTKSKNYELYEMDIDGSNVKRLTNYKGWDTFPSYSPDGKKIVWRRIIQDSTSKEISNSEVFVMQSDGTNIKNLSNHKSFDGYPVWSPDGKQILFSSYRSGNMQLFVMNSDGTAVQQLTFDNGFNSRPDWSSDGNRIVFNKTNNRSVSIHIMDVRAASNITYFNEENSGILSDAHTASRGIAWGDYDNNGFPDLLVANTMNNSNLLYKNDGNNSFTQIVEGAPVTSAGWTEGVNWIDYNNDGYLDIFYTTQGNKPNELYRNDGKGNFEKTEAGDLTSKNTNSPSACWCDYDLDGDLDVYVVERDGANDALFNNSGGNNFVRVNRKAFPYKGGDGRTCAWGDINDDGFPELYVGNFLDKSSEQPTKAYNFFYLNNGGKMFSEISNSITTSERNLSYGTSFIDYDQDDDLDLFVTNISMSDKNLLFQNDGTGNFIKSNTAISKTRNSPSKGHTWGDFDNDGDLDLFITNGTEGTEPEAIMNFLFLSNGIGDFNLIEHTSIVNSPNISAGTAWSDYDRDGDLDIFVANWGNNTESNSFYVNNLYGTQWIEVSLRGTVSNTFGIGAKVQLTISVDGKEKEYFRWLLPQTGYASQNEPILHFGLGNNSSIKIDELKVYWPSGKISLLDNIKPNQVIEVIE